VPGWVSAAAAISASGYQRPAGAQSAPASPGPWRAASIIRAADTADTGTSDEVRPHMGARVATKRQVETKLRELIGRLDQTEEGVRALARALPEPRIIQVDVSDLSESYWTELDAGRMGRLRKGVPEAPDIRVRADSDELVQMVDGRRSLFSSYLGGRIKIEASFADLVRLRKLA
jgi:hypothetical protein